MSLYNYWKMYFKVVDIYMAEFKDRLTEALNDKNISAAELSRLADVNEGAISQYRKGAYKATQENLERLAKALDVSIAWLIGADVPSKNKTLIIGKHNTALKDVLKQLREEKGYTQADLGKKLGVSKSANRGREDYRTRC